ncbi:hypothetical protein [Vibrio mimicus]|uniref:Uncharacterized protein n=2 Tax=Vibrio mimicus TaxID=674 RepID=A0A1D8SFJ8_VIBMI|nr:hypothetical protein [Vibrio mimicus]AOW84137.1 hypothetical protein VM_15580 [Vibrio mimicus]EEY37026.1 hypothetical protein VII_000771 [Vibrio mimicus MB451]EGU17973.1 hypothetical protein SX4_1192 [Vibrio mimicus SX-4]EMB50020.1 hypothetical protein D908_10729 [Vibrio mimicus CAIM 602]KFE30752.1 hypothetical protein DN31_2548 [Vibrio mimicus]
MKVLIQFDQAGSYKDSFWDEPIFHAKGELFPVTPICAVELIENHQAHLYINEDGELVLS